MCNVQIYPRVSLFFVFVIFIILCKSKAEIGPFDGLAKSAIGVAKDFVERWLVQVRIPKIIQNPSNGGISFQLDNSPDGSTAPLPECKECRLGLTDALVGTWHVVLWSSNFFITVIADLDVQIDKMESNQPLADQRTLYEWLRDPPDLRCPQLTVLSADNITKFEFAYTTEPNTKAKSIINKWQTQPDGTIKWILTPKLSAHVCPTVVETDLVVLRQIDSFPRCENIIVLLRGNLDPMRVDVVRDYLESTRGSLALNSLQRTQCNIE